MDDHSQKWHDGSSSWNIDSSSCNSEGITAIVSKVNNLCRDMKKLKENVHAIQLPSKKLDPRSFILLCSNGRLDFNNALAYLGASINVMPFSMYKRLGIGRLEPINMGIEMADNMKCTPKGIVENLLIKINKFIFPVDFVILEMVEDFRMPIILGRPLLATTHAKRERLRDEEDDIVENIKDPEECGEDIANVIMRAIHDKLNDDWFNGTSEAEDELEGILDSRAKIIRWTY
uniref:Reverse transcriptase domain-containing protein n=1 Tax=Tanacetum cinerariifolium TaxID=118510 RepID=A0A6L2KWF2_TANCI|nr:hypothetical protein [Tanacetum cinerariifolium]